MPIAVLLVGSCTLEIVDYPGGARSATCGNGIVDASAGEVCDDGNASDGDGCSHDCRSSEVCGNGIVDVAAGEQCDSGGIDTLSCNGAICTVTLCGDGYVNVAAGEQCDNGPNNGPPPSPCSLTCQLAPP